MDDWKTNYKREEVKGDPYNQPITSLEESVRNSVYGGTDYAADLGYLMNNATDPTDEQLCLAIWEALKNRIHKQQAYGQDIYDETNARAIKWLQEAGYDIDGGSDFDTEPFTEWFDQSGNFDDQNYLEYWEKEFKAEHEPERFGWNGGWLDQDENGNGGYYVPAGKYSEQEWEQALADARIYGRAGSGNMEFLQMRQDQQQEPYDPNQPMQRTRQNQGETLVYQPGRGYVRPEEPAAEVPQTPIARNGTPNWTSYRNPNINTVGNARNEGYLPLTSEENKPIQDYTPEEQAAMWAGSYSDPHHYNGYAGPVDMSKYKGYGGGYGNGYGGYGGDSNSYLSALDALVRGSQATGGLKNSNAVTAGQRTLTSAEAPESEYAKYLRQVADKRYKYITDKRKLY